MDKSRREIHFFECWGKVPNNETNRLIEARRYIRNVCTVAWKGNWARESLAERDEAQDSEQLDFRD